MPKNKRGIFLILLIFILLNNKCLTLIINLILPDNTTPVLLYQNGSYNTEFIENSQKFNCSLSNLYTYSQSYPQNQNNTPYYLTFTDIDQPITFNLTTQYNIFTPNLSQNICPNNNCTITIYNNCPKQVTQFKYFDILQLYVQGLPYPFQYNVLCDSSFNTNTFQWGLVIILIFCTCLLIVVSIYSRAWSLKGAGIKMNYYIIIVFWVIAIIGGVIAFLTNNVIFTILEVVTLIMSIFGVWVCSNQVIFLFRFKFMEKGFIIVREPFKVRIMDILSLLIAIGMVIGYVFTYKNWILNDLLCVCTIVASIKVFKFTNLKIAIFAMLVGLAVQMIFVQVIHYVQLTSYNDLILNNYNYPFQLQLPTINPVYKQKCAWFSFTSVINPGIFISYLRRFDISRNTNIYVITSVIVFLIGSIIWMFISIGSVHSWPFQIVTSPIMIVLVSIFAYQRRQIRTLWQGSFYDQDFANRDGIKDIQQTIQNQKNQQLPEIRNSLLDSLKIAKADSDITSIRTNSLIKQ